MANDNRKNPGRQDQNDPKDPTRDSYPGNPNRQNQDSPRQQQGETGKQHDSSRLHNDDRSVTDRTVKRSVIDRGDETDDDDIDRLKG